MLLEKDNTSHHGFSNKLDDKLGGGPIYEKFTRPIVHGVYHAARSIDSGNDAEWARAKDQFSAVGKGQPRTEYLKAHKEADEAKNKEAQATMQKAIREDMRKKGAMFSEKIGGNNSNSGQGPPWR